MTSFRFGLAVGHAYKSALLLLASRASSCFGSRRFRAPVKSFPTLEGNRIRLRDFAERDLPEFARYRALPEVARYQSWDGYTLEDAKRLYAAQLATPFGTPGSWHQIAIADRADDALVGDCALHFRSEDEL